MSENPAENLMRQFRQCANLFRRHRSQLTHAPREGFTHRGQGRLLRLLLEGDGLPHKDIVEALDIRPSSVSELVARLEQSGHIQRRANETDKRISNVYLTDLGREAAQEISAARQAEENGMFAALDKEEQNQLSALLGKIIAFLRESDSMPEEGGRGKDTRGRGRRYHHSDYHGDHHSGDTRSRQGIKRHGAGGGGARAEEEDAWQ